MSRTTKGTDRTPAGEFRRGVDIVGGQAATARLLGVAQPTVWRWLQGNKSCPAEHVAVFEQATSIDRKKLRPDLFGTGEAPIGPAVGGGAPA